jgi:demethylmenaquinone methyltransferase/2-methoxy-6-polyprenyl-1,4-benzoquinol methylase
VILESSKPSNPLWRLFNNIYLRYILPVIGGVISGNFKAYLYLARSSREYYTRKEMKSILEEGGFTVTGDRSFFLGSVMLVEATR